MESVPSTCDVLKISLFDRYLEGLFSHLFYFEVKVALSSLFFIVCPVNMLKRCVKGTLHIRVVGVNKYTYFRKDGRGIMYQFS